MRFTSIATASFAAIAAAAPTDVEKRQGCQYGFVFARGSTEPAPLGILIGPQLLSALQKQLPGIKSFPVGYAASLATNVSPQRTDDASIKKGVEAFQQAKGCNVIVAGGYSQGAAVMHNVIGGKLLDAGLKGNIAGVALFGDTRNSQDKGHIPNFPTERSKVWCNKDDGVCGGQLNVNFGHLSYSSTDINAAATYLATLAKKGGGGASASSGGASAGGAEGAAGAMPKGGKGGKGKGPSAAALD